MSSEFDERYTAYQVNRGIFRRAIRQIYLRSAESQLCGPTLDVGCGIGELLGRLPAGSKGLEYNRATVAHCRSRGLDVEWYDGEADGWALSGLGPDHGLQSMVVSHVLEHLDQPAVVLARLLKSAERIGIRRALIIVPGPSGFRVDPTHRTFVDAAMLDQAVAASDTGFIAGRARYFPINVRSLGKWFPHHELQLLCRRDESRAATR